MTVMRLSGVCFERSGSRLIDEVTADFSAGQVSSIMGGNGAGKTTLLRLMSGEYAAGQGELSFLDRPLADWPVAERARQLAVLPQHSSLSFPFTVKEVVLMGRTPHRSGHRQDQAIAEAAMREADVHWLAERYYTQLSGGEQQRVQLARVLAQIWPTDQRPGLLLLDEPAASLDVAHRQLLESVVQRMAKEGLAVVMVLHDFNMAARCSDQVLFLRCGSLVSVGTPVELFTQDNLSDVFAAPIRVLNDPESGLPMVFA